MSVAQYIFSDIKMSEKISNILQQSKALSKNIAYILPDLTKKIEEVADVRLTGRRVDNCLD